MIESRTLRACFESCFAFEPGKESLPTNVMDSLSTWKAPRDPPWLLTAVCRVWVSCAELGAIVSLYSKSYVTMMDPHLKVTNRVRAAYPIIPFLSINQTLTESC